MQLCDLPSHLLGELWPPELVLAGMRVCKQLRETMHMHAPDLSLKIAKATSKAPHLQFNPLGGLTGPELSKGEVCLALCRWEAIRSLRVDAAGCKRQAVAILKGLQMAQDRGWPGRLSALNLSGTMPTSESVPQLEGLLQPGMLGQHTELKSLDLSHNRMDNINRQLLANAMVGFTRLTSLNLSWCHVGGPGFTMISPTLEQCRSLTHLNLAWNHLDTEGVKHIGGILRDCPLVYLNLSKCQIGFDEITVLVKDLRYTTNLTHLDMSENYVASESGGKIARSLADCTRLTHLDLHKNSIGCDGLTALSQELQRCTSLTILDLHWNRSRSPAAGRLMAHMCRHNGLKELNLGYNETGLTNQCHDKATTKLAQALYQSSSLTKLHLCRNFLRDPGIKPIWQALGGAVSMAQVHLGFNDITCVGAQHIAAALPDCKALTHLDLRGNKLGDAGMKELAGSLARCPTLAELNVSNNGVGKCGASLVAAALPDCSALRRLDLQENNIGRKGAQRLELLRGAVEVVVDEAFAQRWPHLSWGLMRPALLTLCSRYAASLCA